ncbi:NAD(P)-dependent oxidoreductase [Chloroflexus aggregans]|uniref:6-phosphogluconate dehydrogenase NAD-binding n=1 Tax=Chloroflexus aggregans (strain MD-66 / DSM 9485) TaxID=326427 RepID=B8G923_CHLAD|nr:NAD(P)-dependent oxidoreductase [Chloroflexus aggregans]ACL26298.1 6-phosphogluconate dehydrogenase NAD-binding [Chloroflexus aggregans DSM 9485]
MTQRIGFIGLGVMGKPMARNLHRAGFTVTVWNRSPQPMNELAAEGLIPASSPAELARTSDVVITMLPNGPDVARVAQGADGLFAHMGRGSLFIDMSTIAPETVRQLAAAAADYGIAMLDAPVSGGDKGAATATLSIMVGGQPEDFERALPIFQTLGKTITYCGLIGAGQTVKACNQIAVAITMAAAAEALAFGKAAGIAPEIILRVLGGGLAQSRVLDIRGPTMARNEFRPGFRVRLHQKDMEIIHTTATALGLSLPFSDLVRTHFQRLIDSGNGDLDHSALALTVGYPGV